MRRGCGSSRCRSPPPRARRGAATSGSMAARPRLQTPPRPSRKESPGGVVGVQRHRRNHPGIALGQLDGVARRLHVAAHLDHPRHPHRAASAQGVHPASRPEYVVRRTTWVWLSIAGPRQRLRQGPAGRGRRGVHWRALLVRQRGRVQLLAVGAGDLRHVAHRRGQFRTLGHRPPNQRQRVVGRCRRRRRPGNHDGDLAAHPVPRPRRAARPASRESPPRAAW